MWCLLFHWRRRFYLGGSACALIIGPGQSLWRRFIAFMFHKRYPGEGVIEEIRQFGCPDCGFTWRREVTYFTESEKRKQEKPLG
jgi:hypothetical protein